jgi:hypothetical protein
MTREDFVKKYPELVEEDRISELKILLLKNYSRMNYSISNDTKVSDLIVDYDNMILCEKRNVKIDSIL